MRIAGTGWLPGAGGTVSSEVLAVRARLRIHEDHRIAGVLHGAWQLLPVGADGHMGMHKACDGHDAVHAGAVIVAFASKRLEL